MSISQSNWQGECNPHETTNKILLEIEKESYN